MNSLGGPGAAVCGTCAAEASSSRRSTLAPHSAYVPSLIGRIRRIVLCSGAVPLQPHRRAAAARARGRGNCASSTRVTLHDDSCSRIVTSV